MDLPLVFSQLSRIDGLDYWEGLTRVGCNQEEYAEALRLFCTDLENKYAGIDEFLGKENWKNYTDEIHAVKGGLAGIGAWLLAQKMKNLEDAARNGDYAFCREKTGSALNEMELIYRPTE